MSIIKDEFALALNQVANERGISPDEVIESIEAAVVAAYHKEYQTTETTEEEGITAKVNKNTGETKIFKDEKDITPPGFGRIAAQTAKQVILQKIREAEKKTVMIHYQALLKTIVRARVIRYDGYNAYVDIGKTEAVLPKEEQIKNEHYSVNTSFIVYLKDITTDKFGNTKIVVSRSHPGLIEELFKREVPEIVNNTVVIKKVVREPGERAKIAVFSNQGGVDPVGACVGQKGVRVQTVTDELGGKEKIDIIQWNEDDRLFLIAALSPAKIREVSLDKEAARAAVTVDTDQAALAIGKGGINVDLASKLTGYIIDIQEVVLKEEKEETVSEDTATTQDEEKQISADSAEPQKDNESTEDTTPPPTPTENQTTEEAPAQS